MSVTKIKGKDMTEFDGPVDTGNPHAKRPADKKNGDAQPDESVSKKGKQGTELPGTTTIGEELDSLFEGVEGLSEDFTSRAAVIIEGVLSEKVATLREEIEAEYSEKLDEAYDTIAEDLEGKLNEYLSLFVETYLEENKVAIERGFRNELAESVMESVTSIVEAAGVTLPDEKVDIAEALVAENEELETKYNESLHENIELRKTVRKFEINEAFIELTNGLTEGAKDKLRKLTENIEFTDVAQFKNKLEVLKESFAEGAPNTSKANLTEASDEKPAPAKELDPRKAAYLKAATSNFFK